MTKKAVIREYNWDCMYKVVKASSDAIVKKILKEQTESKVKKVSLCFSCEKRPQKYITGLCESCHQEAIAINNPSV
jgi:hypothetical protein